MKTPKTLREYSDDPHKMNVHRLKSIVVNKVTEKQAEDLGIGQEEARSAKSRKTSS